MDDTKSRLIRAVVKSVRLHRLDGVRMSDVSELTGFSRSTIYRHFRNKEDLLAACFTYVDELAARNIAEIRPDPARPGSTPAEAVRSLWLPYLRFWINHPDEAVFYHCFQDGERRPSFLSAQEAGHGAAFTETSRLFCGCFPDLSRLNRELLCLHILTFTLLLARRVADGLLSDNEEIEDAAFTLMMGGVESCFTSSGQPAQE